MTEGVHTELHLQIAGALLLASIMGNKAAGRTEPAIIFG